MHMTCKTCKGDFCWLCLQPYKNHRDCNKFAGQLEASTKNEKNKMELDLKKYNFYSERFIAHKKAINYAVDKR